MGLLGFDENAKTEEDIKWINLPDYYPKSFDEIDKWLTSFEEVLDFYSKMGPNRKDVDGNDKRNIFIHQYIFSINHAIDHLLQKINDDDLPTFVDRHKSYLRILYEKKESLLKSVNSDANPIEVNQLDELSSNLKKALKDNYVRPKISQNATRIANELSSSGINYNTSENSLNSNSLKLAAAEWALAKYIEIRLDPEKEPPSKALKQKEWGTHKYNWYAGIKGSFEKDTLNEKKLAAKHFIKVEKYFKGNEDALNLLIEIRKHILKH